MKRIGMSILCTHLMDKIMVHDNNETTQLSLYHAMLVIFIA